MLAALIGSVLGHGVMQTPLPWQLGNVQLEGSLPMLGKDACVLGGCQWFTNYTHLPAGKAPTITRDSPMRTFQDLDDDDDWTARNPWRAPGTAHVSSPCGTEGGNADGCVLADGATGGPCVTDAGGFGFGADGRDLGGSGVTTYWRQGGVFEAGWSIAVNVRRPDLCIACDIVSNARCVTFVVFAAWRRILVPPLPKAGQRQLQ
jgi:hypothetical protein